MDALLTDPCNGALSATQLSQLALAAPGTKSQDQYAPSCMWRGTVNTTNSISISPLPANKNGLSDIYANNDDKKYAYFEPTTADGYPGAYAAPSDGRAEGFCSLWVGVTDQLAVMVGTQLVTGANKAHPCDSANKVATAMIEHLKGAQ